MSMEARKGEYRVPKGARPALCSSCSAPIIWTTTDKNKPIPLSVATIRVDEQGERWALNHFSDCPNARQHQRAKAKPGRPAQQAGPEANPGPQADASRARPVTVDLRDLPDYLKRHGLGVTGSAIRDDGNGHLIVELRTRKA